MHEQIMEKFSQEEKESSIPAELIDRGIQESLDLVAALPSRNSPIDSIEAEKFSHTPQGKEKLAFHNIEHTEGVIRRVKLIIKTLKEAGVSIAERDEQLGILAAGSHDTRQNFVERLITETGEFEGLTKRIRVRDIEKNEAGSADDLVGIMKEINAEALHEGKAEIFSKEDERKVRAMINITVPDFKLGTVVQKYLDAEGESSVIERALALADIGTAGMDGPEKFISEGNAIFREDNFDIADVLYVLNDGAPIPEKNKQYYISRMLTWTKLQITFAAGRKERFKEEIKPLPEEAKRILQQEIFKFFDDSINATIEKLQQREKMTFEELAEDIGYVTKFQA